MSQNDNVDSSANSHELLPLAPRFFKQTIPVNIFHFYITDNISDDVSSYIDMINILKTAEEHDKIYLYLNNPGGSISTTIQIINAMREAKATVITSLEGQAYSAATMIFLCGHQCVVGKNCSFMIHTFSEWGGGKGNEQKSRMEFNINYFSKLFNDVYLGFLTPDEIDNILDGTDMWMDSDEVSIRLAKCDEFNKVKFQEEQRENAIENVKNLHEYIDELMTANELSNNDVYPKKKTTKKTTKKSVKK